MYQFLTKGGSRRTRLFEGSKWFKYYYLSCLPEADEGFRQAFYGCSIYCAGGWADVTAIYTESISPFPSSLAFCRTSGCRRGRFYR